MIGNRAALVGSIVLFAVVTMLDVITTAIALNVGANEINPAMQIIVANPVSFLLVKLLAIGILAYLGWSIEQKMEGFGVIALTLASAVTVLVVHNNFSVIVQLIG
jgi:hypothetical protein